MYNIISLQYFFANKTASNNVNDDHFIHDHWPINSLQIYLVSFMWMFVFKKFVDLQGEKKLSIQKEKLY